MNTHSHSLEISRRVALQKLSCGFGNLALLSLMQNNVSAVAPASSISPLAPKQSHFPAKAKRVIFLHMRGAPSQYDTFDRYPELEKDARWARMRQHGESGLWVSDWLPQLARHADDLCVLKAMHTDTPIHANGTLMLHCGHPVLPRPSLGSWVLYGLGTENQNVPGFIALNMPSSFGGTRNYGSAFLPSSYTGTAIGRAQQSVQPGDVRNLSNADIPPAQQQRQMEFVQKLNRRLLDTAPSPEIEGIIQSHETAFKMQMEFSGLMDFTKEPQHVRDAYGVDAKGSKPVRWGGKTSVDVFARQCLLARRFAEAGVRFIELNMEYWDTHTDHRRDTEALCWAVDQPIAALFDDLKTRGLWEDTLILWGGEFGRTMSDNGKTDGTDHNPHGFTMFLAGGAVKGGYAHGQCELGKDGSRAVEGKVHVHDLHATLLHILGLDHEKLTHRYAGRDWRLTDVFGKVVEEVLA
jgi:hypothetical protein